MRFRFAAIAACLVALLAPGRSWAQGGWPAHPVSLIVPFESGGLTDQLARFVAEQLAERLAARVNVVSRPGAGGLIGAQAAAQARPDGYTLIVFSNAILYAAAAAPEPRPDLLARLRPVANIAAFPNILAVHPSIPAENPGELIAYLRVNGRQIVCGAFTPWGDVCRALSEAAGVPVPFLLYGGRGRLNQDLLDGVVRVAATPLAGFATSGRGLRALAVSSATRVPELPDLPTMTESGIPFEMVAVNAIFAPVGTPDAIIRRLSGEVAHIMATPAAQALMRELGAVPGPADIATLDARFRLDWDLARAVQGGSVR